MKTKMDIAPELTWRNGNPKRDICLRGQPTPTTLPVIVLKDDHDQIGNAAPALPLMYDSEAVNSQYRTWYAYGPYSRTANGYISPMYTVHSGGIVRIGFVERSYEAEYSNTLLDEILAVEGEWLPKIMAQFRQKTVSVHRCTLCTLVYGSERPVYGSERPVNTPSIPLLSSAPATA